MKKLNDKLLEKEDELGRLKEKHKKAIGVWEEKSNQLKKVSRTVIVALSDSLFTSWSSDIKFILWFSANGNLVTKFFSWKFQFRQVVIFYKSKNGVMLKNYWELVQKQKPQNMCMFIHIYGISISWLCIDLKHL